MINSTEEFKEILERLRYLNFNDKLGRHLKSKLEAFEEVEGLILSINNVVVSEAELKCMMTDDDPNCDCPINHCKKQGW